ncbi:MAG: bifunctional folylpolyglutamate synthase/dihydrofolate synthase [Thermoguttaceae bacterium]|jgi:dihydrofolate synthase/folylpolyglutamate synthase|nr:bifunctional folylpolyglutamate synthase/dihydrofolate synthase [Thermoguttaceae bacterium]
MVVSLDPTRAAGRRDVALRFLYERIDYERAVSIMYHEGGFKLDRMRELLSRLGNPGRGLPIVHVAGTKGKGSTAAMIAGVLTAAGYRTALFTSPHLDRVEERMAIDGQPCSPDELADLVEWVAPHVRAMDHQGARRRPAEPGPTYFEIITAMALSHFSRRKVDAAVLEVGLGGRLDSTNVCHPKVSVITSISLDHTTQLGHSLEAIAREKAGIIKPEVPVVSGVVESGPRTVIRAACQARQSLLVEMGRDFHFDYHPPRRLDRAPGLGTVDFRYEGPGGPRFYAGVPLGLVGRHQAANAAVALAALIQFERAAGRQIPENAIRDGLARLAWPARVEVVARHPTVVIDAAHNVASVESLVRTLDESFSPSRRFLIFATTLEKDVRGMLKRLLTAFEHVVLTQYLDNPRAVPVEDLRAMAEAVSGRTYPWFVRPADAWDAVRAQAGPDDLICVTGSFFLAAQMRQEVFARPAGPV